jgi:hypothetical protein
MEEFATFLKAILTVFVAVTQDHVMIKAPGRSVSGLTTTTEWISIFYRLLTY